MSIKETAQVYSTLFMDSFPEFKITKPLKTIELFAGYGSQSLALDYLGVGHESVGICEWAWKSILAYKAIHCPNDRTDYSKSLSNDEIFGFLTQAGISTDYNSPLGFGQVKRLGIKKCKEIYNAIIATKDHPDISRAKGSDFLVSDRARVQVLLTYSFPCQDLSNAGKLAGMDEGSGTRSSLLWEVRRILTELKETNQLPDVLLMENVQGVVGSCNLGNFGKWSGFLESLGYSSKVQVLEATDYGVPQTRKRCFMVSVLGDRSYFFPRPIPLASRLSDFVDGQVEEKYFLTERQLAQILNRKAEHNPLQNERQLRGDFAQPICLNPKVEGKQPSIENRVYDPKGTATALTTSFPTKYAESNLRIRKLTPRECFRLMGVADRDSDRLGGFADTALYHFAGDSIVTTCLMAIFAQFYDGLNWLAKAKEKGIVKDGKHGE